MFFKLNQTAVLEMLNTKVVVSVESPNRAPDKWNASELLYKMRERSTEKQTERGNKMNKSAMGEREREKRDK